MGTALLPPTIALTIPSLHDATILSCRVYHPDALSVTAQGAAEEWQGHVAVFAHPYAPLGGSADDGVVDVVAAVLVRRGYLVGTFNFRTSWTAKGETDDYVSFAAFMHYYAHHLRDPADAPAADPVFLMGGYSYGSMITALLPPLPDLLQPFEAPDLGSAAAEIRLRAEHLAEQEREVLARARAIRQERTVGLPRSPGRRVGGTESGEVRRSADRRRSFREGRVRRSIGEVVGRKRRERETKVAGTQREEGPVRLEAADLVVPRTAYLLVSPLQGAILHLATMSFVPSRLSLPTLLSRPRIPFHRPTDTLQGTEARHQEPEAAPEELKLTRNPTLAIYGDGDVFVSAPKLRAWAERLENPRGSRFCAVEVSGAGHFWIEEGVLDKMVGAVGAFSRGVLEGVDLGRDETVTGAL